MCFQRIGKICQTEKNVLRGSQISVSWYLQLSNVDNDMIHLFSDSKRNFEELFQEITFLQSEIERCVYAASQWSNLEV